jgi:large subunit ribosomal protein L24
MRITSTKPGKQRKAIFNVKNHQRASVLSCPLDDALREEFGIRRLPLRKDDRVRVISGEFRDIEGKVLGINKKTRRVNVEECMNEKKDGSTFYVPMPASRLRLTKFAEKKMDPWRQKIIDRRAKLFKEEAEVTAPKKTTGGKE